jgi:hypothetical protein
MALRVPSIGYFKLLSRVCTTISMYGAGTLEVGGVA